MNHLYYLLFFFGCLLFIAVCVVLIHFSLRMLIKTFVSAVACLFKFCGLDGWALFKKLFSDKDYRASYIVQCGRCEQKMKTRRNGMYSCPSCKLEFQWIRGKKPFLVTSEEFSGNVFSQAEMGDVFAQYELAKNYYHGEGTEQNLLQAYKWANLASQTVKNWPLQHLRTMIAGEITANQLEVAQELVQNFVPNKPPELVSIEQAEVKGFLKFAIGFSAVLAMSFVLIVPYFILLYALPQHLVIYLDGFLRLSPFLQVVILGLFPQEYKEITSAAERAIISRAQGLE